MANDKKQPNKLISSNKKAHFDYLLFDKFEAGIALLGTEIKSIRKNGANLKDSYIRISDNLEAYLVNCHISPYQFGNIFNHEPLRERKLLLNKKEILKILNKVKQEKYTIVPGKKLYDKRDSIKKKDIERDIKRHS